MTPCTCHPGNVCASAASCAAARRVEFGANMTTPQPAALPELPEPDLYAHELILNGGGVWLGVPEKGICEQAHIEGETGEEIREFYTADQMRAYALAALQSQPAAAVSDADISRLWSWSATAEAERTATTQQHAFAYALLALRPQAVPMTDREQTYIYPCSGCPTPGRCTDTSGCHAAAMGVPSYYVRHPDDTYTLAIPQPTPHGITAQGAQGGEG